MNRRVLIADSNPDAAETFALLLDLNGFRVVTAHTGPDALAMAAAIHPGAALLALHLPHLSGIDVGRIFCAGLHIPRPRILIAHTGDGSDQARAATRDANFDHHLLKPADPLEVLRILRSLDSCPR